MIFKYGCLASARVLWKNSGGFLLKNEKTWIDMIITLHNEWRNLSKKKNLRNEFPEKKKEWHSCKVIRRRFG